MLGDDVDLVGLHHLGDDRQPRLTSRFREELEPFLLEALECVRRRPRLERAAAQHRGARRLHARGDLEDLFARLHGARAGHDDDRFAADGHVVADAHDAVGAAHLAAGQLERLQDRRDRLHALQRLQRAQPLLAAVVADGADDVAQLAVDGVRRVAHGADAAADVVDFGVR